MAVKPEPLPTPAQAPAEPPRKTLKFPTAFIVLAAVLPRASRCPISREP